MIKVYYRLSNQSAGGYKSKLPHATKEYCLKNCISVFGPENVTILGDRLNSETRKMVQNLPINLVEVDNGQWIVTGKQYSFVAWGSLLL